LHLNKCPQGTGILVGIHDSCRVHLFFYTAHTVKTTAVISQLLEYLNRLLPVLNIFFVFFECSFHPESVFPKGFKVRLFLPINNLCTWMQGMSVKFVDIFHIRIVYCKAEPWLIVYG
jgi:hypothetical protein